MPARLTQEEWQGRAARKDCEFLELVKDAHTRAAIRCLRCGAEWTVFPNTISKGHGCRWCAGNARLSQMEWDRRADLVDADWLEPVAGAHKKAWANCRLCERKWHATPNSISKGGGCPRCGNAIAKTQAEWDAIAGEVDIKWLDVVEGANKPCRAECLLCSYGSDPERPWRPWPGNIVKQTRCRGCRGALDPIRPALVYYVRSETGIGKVGITRLQGTRRLDFHRLRGYETAGKWEVATGHDALAIEAEILKWIRNSLGVPQALTSGNGHTETFDLSMVPELELIQRLSALCN